MKNNNSKIEDKVEETKTEKTFKEILKRNKFIILIVLLIIIVAIVLTILNLNKEETIEEVELSTINLINSELTLEYGEEYEFNLEDFVDDEDLSKYEVIGELEYKEIETDTIDSTEEQEETVTQYENYPEVGEYIFIISAENYEKAEVMVIVEDTTTPELNVPTNIQIVLGTNLDEYDFKQYFESSDLSELNEYNVDYSSVDVNTAGDYVVTVSISDIYENITSKDITISIVETTNTTTATNTSSTNSSSSGTTTNINSSSSTTSTTTTTDTSSSESNDTTNENTSSEDSSDLSYWCMEGGTHHIAGDGENEHGYYETWDLAWEACQEFMKSLDGSAHFKVDQCWCGLYYFWVQED